MKKHKFSFAERYAVWSRHRRLCCLCGEPLRLAETTIDHFIPESLLEKHEEREKVFREYGLPPDFNINGFENWQPCHNGCNQKKGSKPLKIVPLNLGILEALIRDAPKVARIRDEVLQNIKKDVIFSRIYAALEKETITVEDLQLFVEDIGGLTEVIKLDNGYWISKEDIARECECQCENTMCVGHQRKVHCVFPGFLPAWVITKRLYWRCYDELVKCPRCVNQEKQTDEA